MLPRNARKVPSWSPDLWRRVKALAISLGVLYAITLIGLWIVYRVENTVALDMGSSYARPFLHGFLRDTQNDQTAFAYTTRGSTISLPGSASGPYRVRLKISGWRPAPYKTPALTLRSGTFSTTFPLRDVNQTIFYDLVLPPTAGDLLLEFESDLYRPSVDDQRSLGVALFTVEVRGLSSFPPLTTTAVMLVIATLLWWFGLRVGLSGSAATLLSGVVLLCLLVGLAQARLLITIGLNRWMITLLLLHLLLWPLQRLMQTVMRRYDLEITPASGNWLWAIFGLALIFKLGGMLYPVAIFYDQAAHTVRVQMLLDGRFLELYRPGFTSYMGGTVGLESGYMPYSPLWYIIIAPLRLMGIAIGNAMNGLSGILDTSKGLMIFLIALATLRRERAALLASGLYYLLPMPYFLLSWGNYPTQFGLWAALLAITFLTLNYEHMPEVRQWRSFGMWAALLALAILSYTMIGLLAFTMFGVLIVIKALQGIKPNWGIIQALVVGMLVAEIFSFAIYHYQFAAVFVSSTLPSVINSVLTKANAELRTDVEPRESPLSNVLANNAFMRNHTTDLLLIVALIGFVWLYIDDKAGRYRGLWSAWIAILLIYTVFSAYVADMVLKHVFFVMPLICIAAALVLDRIWGRWSYGRWIVIAGLILLFALTADRWWFYMLVKRQY